MANYVYHESDFIGLGSPPTVSINIQGLEQQVLASPISSAGLSYINQTGTDIVFEFDQPLSIGSPNEVLMLNEIVETHDGTSILQATGDTILSFSFADNDGTPLKTLNSTYTRAATVVFEGTDFYEATPVKIEVTGYVEGSAEGTIRIYDLNNDIIIGEKEINNTSEVIINVPIIGEWSEEQTTLELQMKRTSGLEESEYLLISSLQIIF